MKNWKTMLAAITAGIICIAAVPTGILSSTCADPAISASAASAAAASVNSSENDYTIYGSIVRSYLIENSDGSLSRIEAIDDTGVVIENYAVQNGTGKPSYISIGSRTVAYELSDFGGYYQGENYHFLVFGQNNPEESDSKEILRIVKYSKDWKRLGSCSIYGANTYAPFSAGSLRMTEADGSLYIHTCHTMYASSDTLRHQANMTFEIDEATMTETDSLYTVHNISVGYCSHSFNQFITTDGNAIYRVDHGDAYPRAVVITRFEVGTSITDTAFSQVFPIQGETGANATGVSVGGFSLSADNCLVVGNSVDQSDAAQYDAYGQRNIFLSVTDQALTQTNTIWLTNYTENDEITPRTPQLVKISNNQFLIQWEEYHSATGLIVTKMVTVDGNGNKTSDVVSTLYRLSDCQPIVASDGLVKWYVTRDASQASAYEQSASSSAWQTTIYAVDPNDLNAQELLMTGDLDDDGKITIQDAYNTLLAYARISAGLDSGLLDIQLMAADVDGDGKISITDAYQILLYYATESAGGDPSWQKVGT